MSIDASVLIKGARKSDCLKYKKLEKGKRKIARGLHQLILGQVPVPPHPTRGGKEKIEKINQKNSIRAPAMHKFRR